MRHQGANGPLGSRHILHMLDSFCLIYHAMTCWIVFVSSPYALPLIYISYHRFFLKFTPLKFYRYHTHPCSSLKPSYEFHVEGLSNLSPSIEGLVQIQDINPEI